MFFFDSTMILIIPVLILAFYAQSKVKGNYEKFKRVQNSANVTGAEVAEEILHREGIFDVKIVDIEGTLSDHYNPKTKEVSLSKDIFFGSSISAISIAAHEVGHAIQHAKGYSFLNFRTSIVPLANIGSTAAFPLFFIGFLFRTGFLMDLGIIFFSGAFLFHLITLPVEFNASNRAFKQLSNGIVHNDEEMKGVKAVLNAAALTYVASTLMALMQLVRMLILRGSRN
ncbi:MAG: zinc metallopeptidase [Candidatus Cloacimonetes bacterium]|nr:zinc metallopeptidase [Candidatus Cloacimonadota bacterium]